MRAWLAVAFVAVLPDCVVDACIRHIRYRQLRALRAAKV